MSIVIGIKYKDGVIVGADKQSTWGNIKEENSTKIYKSKYSNTALGVVGYLRDDNILATIDEIIDFEDIFNKTSIDLKYVVSKVVPKLFNIYKNNNRVILDKGIESFNSLFAFCTNEKMFVIDSEGAVIENKKYIAIGCGQDLVIGYLETIDGLNKKSKEEIEKIINDCILKSCKRDAYIGETIDLIFLEK
jgi:20S proteasome alpha/beta subunit